MLQQELPQQRLPFAANVRKLVTVNITIMFLAIIPTVHVAIITILDNYYCSDSD